MSEPRREDGYIMSVPRREDGYIMSVPRREDGYIMSEPRREDGYTMARIVLNSRRDKASFVEQCILHISSGALGNVGVGTWRFRT